MKGQYGLQPDSGLLESATPARGFEKRKRSELISFSAHSGCCILWMRRFLFIMAVSLLIKTLSKEVQSRVGNRFGNYAFNYTDTPLDIPVYR